jgi:hypothetical protein
MAPYAGDVIPKDERWELCEKVLARKRRQEAVEELDCVYRSRIWATTIEVFGSRSQQFSHPLVT